MYVGEAAAKLQQTLTFYELDLGLNHVVRKYSEPLEEHANLLISVPGGNDGPSGVIICSENYLTYKNLGDQVICKLVVGLTDQVLGIGILSTKTGYRIKTCRM